MHVSLLSRLVWLIVVSIAILAPEAGRALCVTATKASLRAGPSASHKVTWVVGRYMPLKEIDRRGSWIQVQDLDGEKHWINGASVSSKIECVAVKTRHARLRKSAGANASGSELAMADKYTPFLKIQREGDFIEVEDDYHESYWVADKLVWWPVTRVSVNF